MVDTFNRFKKTSAFIKQKQFLQQAKTRPMRQQVTKSSDATVSVETPASASTPHNT